MAETMSTSMTFNPTTVLELIYAIGNGTDEEIKNVIRKMYLEARKEQDSYLADQIMLTYAGMTPSKWAEIIEKANKSDLEI